MPPTWDFNLNATFKLKTTGSAKRGFWQRNCCMALANWEKNAFRVTCPMFSTVVRVPRNDPVETWSDSCFVICRRAFGVVWYEKRWFRLPVKWNSSKLFATISLLSVCSSRRISTLHITVSWLPIPIGQVRSQVWCRPYLAAHFGFFDLRTFLWVWSLS